MTGWSRDFLRQSDLTPLTMTVPLVMRGFGLGTIGGPLADMWALMSCLPRRVNSQTS
ncbi:hypothetical protein GCM10009837_42530 [Streptomyces durmitorensis]